MSDTNSGRKVRHNLYIECLNFFESESDQSNQSVCYRTYKKENALKVVHPVNDR